MASNTQLPKGTYYDPNGRKFTINTLQRRQVNFNVVYVINNFTMCLIDGVYKNLLEGSCMKLFPTPVTPEYVDIIGASDRVEALMYNLMVATYYDVETSAQGERCLGVFLHCIRYGKGKSILS